MRNFMLTLLTTALLLSVSACSVLGVYRIDIPQGTPLTQAQVTQLKLGMTPQQVRYILGSPSVTDTLNPKRWDYIYHYVPGSYARRAGLKPVKQQQLTLRFDQQDVLVEITGQDTIPHEQPGLPGSKDTTLTAPPL
jgi:outer membrane protein assembly factor BamE